MKTIKLPDKTEMPAIGQGTWRMGENPVDAGREKEALGLGIELGMTMIDTAEMYGDGGAERVAGDAIRGYDRDGLFLVSKVYPYNANRSSIYESCENSLRRLRTDYLDLYLLHWREDTDLDEVVWLMQDLIEKQRILRWGVSNFDTADMEDLWQVDGARGCAVNQILYNLGTRGPEYDLFPWQREMGVPMMAYCPVAQAGSLKEKLLASPELAEVARRHGADGFQVLLAFVLRDGDIAAIPKAAREAHVRSNAAAGEIRLSADDLKLLSAAFPAPDRKVEMEKV
jgi:diketogulonate reductase-like aldo/keto reductase